MNRRIGRLVDAGVFRSPEIDKLGHGTFLGMKGIRATSYTERAKMLRREAESTLGHSRRGGIMKYMETVFLYVKEYTRDKNCRAVDDIHRWKGLRKYVESIMRLLREDERKAWELFRLIVFNIRFHYLHLESSLMTKQCRAGKIKDGTQLLYFLKEYNDLHEALETCGAEGIRITRPCDLEDMVRSRVELDGDTWIQ